jgi:hypothetical protein
MADGPRPSPDGHWSLTAPQRAAEAPTRHVPDTHERWRTDDKAPSTSIPGIRAGRHIAQALPRSPTDLPLTCALSRCPNTGQGHDADHDTPCLGCPQRSGPQRSEDTRSGGRRDAKLAPDPDRARFGSRLPWLRARTASGEPEPPRSSLTVVSGRVRLIRWDVDRVFGTGAGCRRAGD